MLEYADREVEFPNRFKLVPVNGTTDTFDLVPVPGQVTKEGRALNKEFFDSIKSEIGTVKNDIKTTIDEVNSLSNVYNIGILTTESRILSDVFSLKEEWTIESDLKVTHKQSGITVSITEKYSDSYNAENFIDCNDNTSAMNSNGYMTFHRAAPWRLKQILGKIRSERSSGHNYPILIGNSSRFSTGTYQSFSETVADTNQFDFTMDTEQADFYMCCGSTDLTRFD